MFGGEVMIKKYLEKIKKFMLKEQSVELENIAIQNGLILEELNKQKNVRLLQDVEFKIFSQFGEDGIVSYLVNVLGDSVENKKFIEFGVENYQESNTRYLMMSKNWGGVIIDGSKKNMDYVKSSYFYWRHDLKAISQFITAENIDSLLLEQLQENEKNIGLLSVDIDGNDYYVFDAIKSISADILILEYNSVFGKEKSVTIPYESDFYRYDKSFTGAYFGASLKALIKKAEEKGYSFLGTNNAGNNAFFVKNEHQSKFPNLNIEISLAKFRQPTAVHGKEILTQKECLYEVMDMPIIDLANNKLVSIKDIYGAYDV